MAGERGQHVVELHEEQFAGGVAVWVHVECGGALFGQREQQVFVVLGE